MKKLLSIVFITALSISSTMLSAQTPLSGFNRGKGQGTVAFSMNSENYSKVLLVPGEINGVPVFREVAITSFNTFVAYGITNKLEAVLSLPQITAKGSATDATLGALNFQNERKGIQDLSAFLKYNITSMEMGANKLNISIGGGIQTPLGDYKVDEGLQSILSIGNRATSYTGVALAQFNVSGGLFVGGQLGYSIKSGVVPNAILSQIKAGYAGSRVYVAASLASQKSTSGVDILRDGFVGVFPATKVNFNKVGIDVYIPIVSGVGISGGYGTVLSGRNIGKSSGYYGGVAISF